MKTLELMKDQMTNACKAFEMSCNEQQVNLIEAYKIGNGLYELGYSDACEKYLQEQLDLGYSFDDIEVRADKDSIRFTNLISSSCCSVQIKLLNAYDIEKHHVLALNAIEEKLIKAVQLQNRELYLNNEQQALGFVKQYGGYPNKPSSYDLETIDYLKSVWEKLQEQKKLQIAMKERKEEEGLMQLKEWALNNGSEQLQLRIKHAQNFKQLASEEWFAFHYPEFCDDVPEEDVENGINVVEYVEHGGTLEDLQELDKMTDKYPDVDGLKIIKYKIKEYQETSHVERFIFIEVESPCGISISGYHKY